MRSNFEFLKEKFPEFYKKANDAEKALMFAPTMCVGWCRLSLESGLKYIAQKEQVSLYKDNISFRERDIYELIKDEKMDLMHEVKDYCHKVRKMGNDALHGKISFSKEDAILTLKWVHLFFVYIYENYVYYNESDIIPNYLDTYYSNNNEIKSMTIMDNNLEDKGILEELVENNSISQQLNNKKKEFRLNTITKEDKERLSIWTEDEELSTALEKSYDEWKIYLHPKQRKVVEKSYNGPVLVEGGPGTGKSLVGIYRALELSKTIYPANEGKKILFLTFTKNLVKNLERDIDKIYKNEGIEKNVIVQGIDSLLLEIGHEIGIITNYSYDLDKDIKKLNIYKNKIGNRFLKYEYEEVILKRNINSLEEYIKINSSLERDKLSDEILEISWELLEKIKGKRMKKKNSSELSYLLREKIKNKELEAKYDSIIIDETQDLSGIQVEVLSLLCKNRRNNLFFLSDPYQRIYKLHNFDNEFKMQFGNRKELLKVNYRTTGQIKKFADTLFSNDQRFKEKFILENLLLGKKVDMVESNDYINKIRERINDIKQQKKYKPEEIGILAYTNNELISIESMGKKAGIDMNLLKSGASIMEDNVNLATFAGCKGLEFKVVLVVEKESYKVEEGPYEAFEKRLIDCQKYVAYTRGREKLEIIKAGRYDD